MPLVQSAWRASDPPDCLCHAFPEGVVVFRLSDKSSFYLPHPAGRIFMTLREQSRNLRVDDLPGLMEGEFDGATLEAVLGELERLRLVERSP